MTSPIPNPPILNLDAVELIDLAERARQRGGEMPTTRFGGRIGPIAPLIGARRLGYNLTEVAPGKAAFPKHSHRANEEMFFVLSGTGELRYGDATYPVRTGDVIACPPGGPDTAHQLINTGDAPLRYLAFYAQALAPLGYGVVMDVTKETSGGYEGCGFGPSGKPAFWVGTGTGEPGRGMHIAFVAKTRAEVDAFHAAALAAGGTDNGAPGLRPHYHPNYYGAFVIDPDGHNIEAVCHAPE